MQKKRKTRAIHLPPTFFAMSYSFIKCFIFDIDDTYTITNTPASVLKKNPKHLTRIGLKYFISILIKIIIFIDEVQMPVL